MRHLILICALLLPMTARAEDVVDHTLDKAKVEAEQAKESVRKADDAVDKAAKQTVEKTKKAAHTSAEKTERATEAARATAIHVGRATRDVVQEVLKGSENGFHKGQEKARREMKLSESPVHADGGLHQ